MPLAVLTRGWLVPYILHMYSTYYLLPAKAKPAGLPPSLFGRIRIYQVVSTCTNGRPQIYCSVVEEFLLVQ